MSYRALPIAALLFATTFLWPQEARASDRVWPEGWMLPFNTQTDPQSAGIRIRWAPGSGHPLSVAQRWAYDFFPVSGTGFPVRSVSWATVHYASPCLANALPPAVDCNDITTGYDIVLRHDLPDSTQLYTRYLHLDPGNKTYLQEYFNSGSQFIPQGYQIGVASDTGYLVEGIHLHFDVQGSVSVDAGLNGRPVLNMQGLRWYSCYEPPIVDGGAALSDCLPGYNGVAQFPPQSGNPGWATAPTRALDNPPAIPGTVRSWSYTSQVTADSAYLHRAGNKQSQSFATHIYIWDVGWFPAETNSTATTISPPLSPYGCTVPTPPNRTPYYLTWYLTFVFDPGGGLDFNSVFIVPKDCDWFGGDSPPLTISVSNAQPADPVLDWKDDRWPDFLIKQANLLPAYVPPIVDYYVGDLRMMAAYTGNSASYSICNGGVSVCSHMNIVELLVE